MGFCPERAVCVQGCFMIRNAGNAAARVEFRVRDAWKDVYRPD